MQSSGNSASDHGSGMGIIWLPSKLQQIKVKELKSLRTMIKGFVDRGETPFIELLLAKAGKVVFWEAHGKTEVVSEKPIQKDAICNIASSTKPLSATCLMILVDEEKIKLDDPVSKYLPAFELMRLAAANKTCPSPTVRQLLSHTSGLAGLWEMTASAERAIRNWDLTLAQSVNIIAEEKILALPGERFSYGGLSYSVAGRITEVVSGMPFEQFMLERLLKPLGMQDTTFKPDADQGERVVNISKPDTRGCQTTLSSFDLERDSLGKKLILVGGGLYASAKDLAIFLQMHLNGGIYAGKQILSETAVAEMQKDQIGNANVSFHPVPESQDYGLGWVRDRFGRDGETCSVSHPGMFGTIQWIDSDRNLLGILFTPMPLQYAHPIHRLVRSQVLALFPKED